MVDADNDPLLNLRFADDVVLFATSAADTVKMTNELSREAAKCGLKLHIGKTVVLKIALANAQPI